MKTRQQLADWTMWVYNSKWLYGMGCYGQRLQTHYSILAKSGYYVIENPSGFKKLTAVYNTGANPRLYDCHGIVDGFRMDDGSTAEIDFDPSLDIRADTEMTRVKASGILEINYGPVVSTMKDNAGYGYWKPGHFGVGVGNGEVVDIYSTGYPARKRDQMLGGWTNWLQCYDIYYGEEDIMSFQAGAVKGQLQIGLWQVILVALGYDLGPYGVNKDGVDLSYGELSRTATIDFKTKNDLPANTVVNEAVLSKALAALKAKISAGGGAAEIARLNGLLAVANQSISVLNTKLAGAEGTISDLRTDIAAVNQSNAEKLLDLKTLAQNRSEDLSVLQKYSG